MIESGLRRRRRRLTWACAFVLAVIGSGGALSVLSGPSDPASAAQVPFEQCNGVSNGGGETVECSIEIVNNLTDDPGTTGSVVIINGGAPMSSPDLVTIVNQCNGSANGGGGTLRCSVTITNNISVSGASAATPVTVNQCNDNQPDGLGTAPNVCVPEASMTGATITQCNGSGNGGGLRLGSGCTASGTVSSTLPVMINQCNDSANGGGSQVVCSSTINTIVTGVQPTTTTSPGPTTGTLPSTR